MAWTVCPRRRCNLVACAKPNKTKDNKQKEGSLPCLFYSGQLLRQLNEHTHTHTKSLSGSHHRHCRDLVVVVFQLTVELLTRHWWLAGAAGLAVVALVAAAVLRVAATVAVIAVVVVVVDVLATALPTTAATALAALLHGAVVFAGATIARSATTAAAAHAQTGTAGLAETAATALLPTALAAAVTAAAEAVTAVLSLEVVGTAEAIAATTPEDAAVAKAARARGIREAHHPPLHPPHLRTTAAEALDVGAALTHHVAAGSGVAVITTAATVTGVGQGRDAAAVAVVEGAQATAVKIVTTHDDV